MDSFQLLITFVFIFIVYLVINQITFSRTLQLCIIVIFVLHYQKADKSNCIGFDYFAVLNKFKNFNMTKYFEPKKAYKPTLYLDDHKENFREIDLINIWKMASNGATERTLSLHYSRNKRTNIQLSRLQSSYYCLI